MKGMSVQGGSGLCYVISVGNGEKVWLLRWRSPDCWSLPGVVTNRRSRKHRLQFVEAQQEAKLTANVSGKITGKYFNGGDRVEAGQVLFTIDQRTYKANLLNAQAGLAAARTEYNRLAADAERYKKLYEQNAVSKQQYDLVMAQRDSAQAQVAAHEAILENAQISMGDTQYGRYGSKGTFLRKDQYQRFVRRQLCGGRADRARYHEQYQSGAD